MRTPKAKYVIAALLAIVGFALQQAKADFVSFINSPNTALSGFTGPYAEVTIHLVNTTTADVTFTSLTNTFNGSPVIYLMGDGQSADLNVNGTFTVSDLTKTVPTGFFSTHAGPMMTTLPDLSFTIAAGQNVDDQGTFNLTINNFDGYTHAADSISFTLNATGSTTWANAGSVLFFNGDGIDAAAHIFPADNPPDVNVNTFQNNTGFAGENAAGVPDGGMTAMLLGAGLSGLGLMGRLVKR